MLRVMRQHFNQVSWLTIGVMLLGHALLTYVLLTIVGEHDLVSADAFLYYYVVTTSTVGFGDLSPTSQLGKLIVALVQIPLGLAIFGALLGKLGQTVSRILRKIMTGEQDFQHLDTHILIFGWHPSRTGKMIQHILGDSKRQQRKILLCVTQDNLEHPFLDNPMVEFARLSSFTDDQELARVNVHHADKIIVDCENDDMTFTCALKLSPLVETDCHISAYFNEEAKIEMLNRYTDNVESNTSRIAETLVRSMQDPGISRLHNELMSTLDGDTQFSTLVPKDAKNLTFETLFYYFKQHHNSILLAVAEDKIGNHMHLNPAPNFAVLPGHILHYVAKSRILSSEINWQQLAK